MVLLLEIPEFIYPILFAGIAMLVIYTVQPPQVNYVSAPISNFTNINKTVLYSVDKPDNITSLIYKYGFSKLSQISGISKHELFRQLLSSKTFFALNCTGVKEKHFGDPINKSLDCLILGERYVYNQ